MKKLVLSVAFAAFGTFAMAQQTQQMPSKWGADHKQMMEQKKADHMAQMQKDLNLTPAQVSQINAMHSRYEAQREQQRIQNQQLKKQRMEGFQKDKQQMDDDMRKILTPEQYQKWQAKKQENMQKRRENMQKWDGKKPMKQRGMVGDMQQRQPLQK